MSSIQSITSNLPPPSLTLQRVIGEGREERWKAMEQIFIKQIASFYGTDSISLLAEIKKDPDVKCRLLYEKKKPVGVLVYSIDLTDRYNLRKCLNVKMLYSDDQGEENVHKPYSTFLLDQVEGEISKEYKAGSLCIKVSKKAVQILEILKQRQYKPLDESHNASIYGKPFDSILGQSFKKAPKDHSGKEEQDVEKEKKTEIRKRKADDTDLQDSSVDLKKARGDKEEQVERAPFPTNNIQYQNNSGMPRVISHTESQAVQLRFKQAGGLIADSVPIKLKYFYMIRNREKTVEIRVDSGRFKRLREGQFIEFKNGNEKVACEITRIERYRSFASMLENEGYERCLPDARSFAEALKTYEDIYNYQIPGVLAIHVMRIS